MDEIKEELDEITYKLWQNYELMRILNAAIDYNLESDNELAVINLSEIIENQLKIICDDLDEIPIKMYKFMQQIKP